MGNSKVGIAMNARTNSTEYKQNLEAARGWVKKMSTEDLKVDARTRGAFHDWYNKAVEEELAKRNGTFTKTFAD